MLHIAVSVGPSKADGSNLGLSLMLFLRLSGSTLSKDLASPPHPNYFYIWKRSLQRTMPNPQKHDSAIMGLQIQGGSSNWEWEPGTPIPTLPRCEYCLSFYPLL